MIEAVLFDLDGTLTSFSASYADFMRKMAARWGITDATDPFFMEYSSAILASGTVTFQSSIEHALKATGRSVPKDVSTECQESVAKYTEGIQLLPHALSLINRYSSLPTAIVSNGPFDMQLSALKKFGLHNLVNEVIISGDPEVGVRKPNSEIFRIACSRLGVDPSQTLMIGDNEVADVQGAKDAGLQAVLIGELVSAMFEKLSDEQRRALSRITPSHDRGLAYFPCCVELTDGTIHERVYIVSQLPYLNIWGVYPADDAGKSEVKLADIARIHESPQRLPAAFATELYAAGESGMGYVIFSVTFSDGSKQTYASGNAVDFIQYPAGKSREDVVSVQAHDRSDMNYERAQPYAWCLYSE